MVSRRRRADDLMKTKAEVLEILPKETTTRASQWLERLAVFGSYAREDQREDSDVDILLEIEPEIGLCFVELADRIEDALGVRAEFVSRRAISHVIGRSSKRNWSMSHRTTPLLVEDIQNGSEAQPRTNQLVRVVPNVQTSGSF
jgi:uncharacterized protein